MTHRLLKLSISMLLACVAAPALAQQQGPEFRNPTVVTPPDQAILKEAAEAAKASGGGSCEAVFNVGVDGKPNSIKPNCTEPALDPFIVRAVESMVYLPEIYRYEVFEAEGVKQPFNFETRTVTMTAPVAKSTLEARDIKRMQDKVGKAGTCAITMSVTASGKPKDVVPNCTPSEYDPYIKSAAEKLDFEPATSEGKKVDWPKFELQIVLNGKG